MPRTVAKAAGAHLQPPLRSLRLFSISLEWERLTKRWPHAFTAGGGAAAPPKPAAAAGGDAAAAGAPAQGPAKSNADFRAMMLAAAKAKADAAAGGGGAQQS